MQQKGPTVFGIGGTELAIILIFGFLIFGPDRLPAMGRTIGRALRQFRQAQDQMNKMVQSEIVNPLNESMKEPAKKQGPKKKVTGAAASAKPETFAEKKARLAAESAAAQERKAARAAAASGEADEATIAAEQAEQAAARVQVPEKPQGRSETFAEKKARREAEKAAAEAKQKADDAAKAAGAAAASAKPAVKQVRTKATGASKAGKLYGLTTPVTKPAGASDAASSTTTGKGDQADA